MNIKPYHIFIYTCLVLVAGCNKESFLDKKPSTDIIVPGSLAELRGMLDYTAVFNWTPGIGELSADNYYLSATNWQAQNETTRNAYTWDKQTTGSSRSMMDWTECTTQVLYANIVLEQVEKLNPASTELTEWKDIKGSALFLRAYSNYKLLSVFAAAYDSSTAGTDPGIPLRKSPDIHSLQPRSSVKESYESVSGDLNAALTLLQDKVSLTYKNRPSRPAVYALLSRISLSMRRYNAALQYADSALNLYSTLINYNTLSVTASTPFDRYNDETLFYSTLSNYSILSSSSAAAYIDTSLYQSYNANDLRKQIYFRVISGTNMGMKTGYTGSSYANGGLCVDELYLNRAEAYARAGNITAAMNDLNTVLVKRWKTGSYTNMNAVSAGDALQKIQTERRKELIWRGLRWTDLKRYNKEGAGISLTRILNGLSYTLAPNSNLYVLPIPADETEESGIAQNPR